MISKSSRSRVAIIDLGTNTFNLLFAEKSSDDGWRPVKVLRKTVKLGKGGLRHGIIAPAAFQRGLKALVGFSELIRRYDPGTTIALATSGIRSTSNGTEFIRQVHRHTGIRIKTITGEQEAGLILDGVRQTLPDDIGKVLIMDIGGGSTEFIIADKKKTYWKRSFAIGVSRLRERFEPSDTITKTELVAVTDHLQCELLPLFQALEIHKPSSLVGASGSFESFSAMIAAQHGQKDMLSGSGFIPISKKSLTSLHRRLIHSDSAQRRRMKGLVSMRMDMIVIASISTDVVLKAFPFKKIHATAYALKEGVAIRWARTGKV